MEVVFVGEKPWYAAAQWSVVYRAEEVMGMVEAKRRGLNGVSE